MKKKPELIHIGKASILSSFWESLHSRTKWNFRYSQKRDWIWETVTQATLKVKAGDKPFIKTIVGLIYTLFIEQEIKTCKGQFSHENHTRITMTGNICFKHSVRIKCVCFLRFLKLDQHSQKTNIENSIFVERKFSQISWSLLFNNCLLLIFPKEHCMLLLFWLLL